MRRPRRNRVRLDVQSHPSGLWLVRADRRRLAVSPEMGQALLRLHGSVAERRDLATALCAGAPAHDRAATAAALVVAGWLAGDAGSPPTRRHTSLPLRVPLVPAAAVRAAARVLAPLASWPALAAAGGGGFALLAMARPWAAARVPSLGPGPALILFAVCSVWHELGHAAALRREGYAPGGIGAGWLIFLPVLYADVSAVALLPRAGRLRVDLAGIAFQAGAAGVMAGLARWASLPKPAACALGLAATATTVALVGALLPLPRSDGGWALRDALADTTDTDAPREVAGDYPASRRLRRARLVLRGLQHALMGLACLLLPSRIVGLAGRLLGLAGVQVGLPVLVVCARVLTVAAVVTWAVRRLFPRARRAWPALSCKR